MGGSGCHGKPGVKAGPSRAGDRMGLGMRAGLGQQRGGDTPRPGPLLRGAQRPWGAGPAPGAPTSVQRHPRRPLSTRVWCPQEGRRSRRAGDNPTPVPHRCVHSVHGHPQTHTACTCTTRDHCRRTRAHSHGHTCLGHTLILTHTCVPTGAAMLMRLCSCAHRCTRQTRLRADVHLRASPSQRGHAHWTPGSPLCTHTPPAGLSQAQTCTRPASG